MSQDQGYPFDEYLWTLKRFFPGDSDFSVQNYQYLPYHVVVSAVKIGAEMRQNELHELERPTAQLSAIYANSKRDPKKGKVMDYKDFSFYKPRKNEDLPASIYGSAAMLLIHQGRFPSWALFCYKDLSSLANMDYKPELPAFIAEDAILLHPIKVGDGWQGMLIAQESASEKRRVFDNGQGGQIALSLPHVHTKVIAQEGAILTP